MSRTPPYLCRLLSGRHFYVCRTRSVEGLAGVSGNMGIKLFEKWQQKENKAGNMGTKAVL